MTPYRDQPPGSYQESTYGERWAPYYDDLIGEPEISILDLLEAYAKPSLRALELAVGTGRIAIPLASRGIAVTGVDISPEMIAKLRAKPGGEGISIVMGDLVDADIEAEFPLAYLPFNTLFALLSQERQLACFRNTAKHLEVGGRFVLDCFVPDVKRYDAYNTRMAVSSITSTDSHAYEVSIHHPVEQRVTSHHVRRLNDGSEVVLPVTVRYAWPAEMDLMARLAGLELEDRWGWYDRRPFTEASSQHVSVYRK